MVVFASWKIMVVDNHQEEDGKESWDGAVDNNLALQAPQLREARVDGDDGDEAEDADTTQAREHMSGDVVTCFCVVSVRDWEPYSFLIYLT